MNNERKIWNNRTIPENKDEIIEKIKQNLNNDDNDESNDENTEDDINIGLKQITSFIICDDSEIAAMVITPSGLVYNFKSNISEMNDEDIWWWMFALKNYKNYIHNTEVKDKIFTIFNVDNESIKFKSFTNKKNENKINITPIDLFNCFYP